MKDLSSEELEKWAIRFIGVVDYDIEKECTYNIEDEGEDSLVVEMMDFILHFMKEVKED